MSMASITKIGHARDALQKAFDKLLGNAYDALARKFAREMLRKAEAWIKEAREGMRVIKNDQHQADAAKGEKSAPPAPLDELESELREEGDHD